MDNATCGFCEVIDCSSKTFPYAMMQQNHPKVNFIRAIKYGIMHCP